MRQPEPRRRGRLKVFLSYAAGAGKTYRMLEEALELKQARNLHIETRVLQGQNPVVTLVEFAHRHKVTQIFLTRSRSRRSKLLPGQSLVPRVLRLAHDIQVTVVAERKK